MNFIFEALVFDARLREEPIVENFFGRSLNTMNLQRNFLLTAAAFTKLMCFVGPKTAQLGCYYSLVEEGNDFVILV